MRVTGARQAPGAVPRAALVPVPRARAACPRVPRPSRVSCRARRAPAARPPRPPRAGAACRAACRAGAWAGGSAGGVAGAIIGFVTYDRTTNWFGPGFNAVATAIFVAIPGLIIGGVIGSKMTKFNIRGNKEKFKMMKYSILEMSAGHSRIAPKDSSITN